MKRILILSTIGIIFSLVFIFILIVSQARSVSTKKDTIEFVVNQGDGIVSISSRLEKNSLIRNKYIFILYAYKLGLNNHLQAGTFRLSQSLSTQEIVKKLSQGGSNDYWLKIIEGQRIEEITPRFALSLEGYLFPDSYLIPKDYNQSQILEIINKNFNKKIAEAKIDATNASMTDNQIVILASMLEREGRTLETKQKIAGILLNRLKINMALQVDATVQYARDKFKKVYWEPVTKSDLKISSPYNTYLHPGLPPGPICNPGFNSLFAAFHPTDSDYMYYITDSKGNIHFAKTLDEHNANISDYL